MHECDGEPKKLKDGRAAYTMYLDREIRAAIDEYVYQVKQDTPGFSRSDFLNEAAEFYLAALKKGEKRNGNRDDQQA